ncbi:CAP-associated domain-containing protein [Carnobacterium sp. TMP28]|uniref:CAP-associated domain-containing protein n=1 Tax=Carnobacterium sp. TMP28 TaxID=3397060 RepID=UPI0039E01F88
MKTILRTLPIFLVLMLLTYFVPQIISDNPSEIVTQKKNVSELKKEAKTNSIPPVKQEIFPLEGIGQYVGGTLDLLEKKYGRPLRIEPTSYSYEWWVYGDNEKDYFQVGVSKEDKIVSLFVLGSTLDVSPFKVGMDISEVYQLTPLYPTFSIEYENKDYTIELSENDLNYHPIVMFEKNIFSILMVDRKTNKINAIRYVNKQTLLQSDIYEVFPQNEGITKKNLIKEVEDEKGKIKEVEVPLNALRKRYNLSELTYNKELSSIAKAIFINQEKMTLEQSNEEAKKRESSLVEGSIKIESSNENETIQDKFVDEVKLPPLTSKETQDYLKLNKLTLLENRIVYSNQFTNPTWLITYWFSLENQRTILTDPLMKRFGVAFRGEEVLLILDKPEELIIK